jgi:hypothetical protein
VQAFDAETEQVYTDEQSQLKLQVVIDWPVSAGILGGEEYKRFFEWAKRLNNYHPDIKHVSFQHLHCSPVCYQTKLYYEQVNSFNISSEEEQEFYSVIVGCDSGRNSFSLKNCSLHWKIIRPEKKLKKCFRALIFKVTKYAVQMPVHYSP